MRCPRCTGCLCTERIAFTVLTDTFCIQCGWHDMTPDVPPIEPDLWRRWQSVLCVNCDRHAIRGHERCRACLFAFNARKSARLLGVLNKKAASL